MATSKRQKLARDRVSVRRERLRRQGLRPIEVWVPDVGSRSFKAQAHRQSLAVARSPLAKVDQGFVDSVSDWCIE